MIEAHGLTKRFGSTVALDGVDLEVPTGTILSVLGPNGAGKTTAVRILTTLLEPDVGSARVAGHDVMTETKAVQATIGVTGQDATVDEMMTGRQNLVMIGRLRDSVEATPGGSPPTCSSSSSFPRRPTGS